jgi:tetratricopeptide (TPR) repeat protein
MPISRWPRRGSIVAGLVLTAALPPYATAAEQNRPKRSVPEQTSEPADARLKDASTALYSGNPDRALQLASAVLKQHPNSVTALVLAARAHVARDEYVPAYDLLRKAIEVDPHSADVLYFLGIVTSELATREYDRVYSLAPDGPRVHQLMAQSLKLQGKIVEAAAEYELALRAKPDLIDALIDLAAIRREESNCDEAITLYERAEKVRATYEGTYGLGVCLAAQNAHAEAADEFRNALKHVPDSAAAHFGLGSALLQLGDPNGAILALERAVSLEPRMRQAYYVLGRAYQSLGLREHSRQAFARADELAKAEHSKDQKALAAGRRKHPQ